MYRYHTGADRTFDNLLDIVQDKKLRECDEEENKGIESNVNSDKK